MILDPQNCLEGPAEAQTQVLHTVELSNLFNKISIKGEIRFKKTQKGQ
jgi:hypothetical protein